MIWHIENAPAGEGKSGTHSALRWGQGRSVSPRKKQSCAAIDFRPSVSLFGRQGGGCRRFPIKEMALANMGNGE